MQDNNRFFSPKNTKNTLKSCLMNTHLLTEIPCPFDHTILCQALHIRPGSSDAHDLSALIVEAQSIARPKALYKYAKVDSLSERSVTIGGILFESHILSVNLEHSGIVYPFIVSCGMELETWAHSIDDMLWSYWAEGIKQAALENAFRAFEQHLEMTYHPGATSTMSPGSLENWPITQQAPLFTLLGDTHTTIGVQLTPSMLMIPNKSVSGIVFERDHSFTSCQLCSRENCPGRRAPYDETLYEREYCPAVK